MSIAAHGTTSLEQFVDFLQHAAGDDVISDNLRWGLSGAVNALLNAGNERSTWTLPLKEYTTIKAKLDSAKALLQCALAELSRARSCHERLTALRNGGVPSSDPMMSALELGELKWLRLKGEMNISGILIYLAKLSTSRNAPLLAMSLVDYTWLTLATDSFDARFTAVFAQLELCHKNHLTTAYTLEQTSAQSSSQLVIDAVSREGSIHTARQGLPRAPQYLALPSAPQQPYDSSGFHSNGSTTYHDHQAISSISSRANETAPPVPAVPTQFAGQAHATRSFTSSNASVSGHSSSNASSRNEPSHFINEPPSTYSSGLRNSPTVSFAGVALSQSKHPESSISQSASETTAISSPIAPHLNGASTTSMKTAATGINSNGAVDAMPKNNGTMSRPASQVSPRPIPQAGAAVFPVTASRSMLPLSPGKDKSGIIAKPAPEVSSRSDSRKDVTTSIQVNATTQIATSMKDSALVATTEATTPVPITISASQATTTANGLEKIPTTKRQPSHPAFSKQRQDESFANYLRYYSRPFQLTQAVPSVGEASSNIISSIPVSSNPSSSGRDAVPQAFVDTVSQRITPASNGQVGRITVPGVRPGPYRPSLPRQPSGQQPPVVNPSQSQTPLRNIFHGVPPTPYVPQALPTVPVTRRPSRVFVPHSTMQMASELMIQSVDRKTIATDILRALGAPVPSQHTGKRKRGKASAIPTAAAESEPTRADALPIGSKSTQNKTTSAMLAPTNADAEILSPAVLEDALQASVRALDSDATVAPMDQEPDDTVRTKEPPLFWSDDSSNEDLEPRATFDGPRSRDSSEADVDALLGHGSSSSRMSHAEPSRTTTSVHPSSANIDWARRGIAHEATPRHWPVDRVLVEVPLLPKGWLPREKEVMYGEFDDFKERLSERKCEWDGCPAVLNSEQHLARHWDKVHRPQIQTNANNCKWDDCTLRFSSCDRLRRHLRLHIRDHLRCAYQDCNFKTRIEAELADHVRSLHVNSTLRPTAALHPVTPVQRLPDLPNEAPTWRLVTPPVRAPAISRERHQQLGNWVLFKISGKIDLEPALIKVTPAQRRRKDFAPQTVPLLEGFPLELQQQYLWSKSDETFKGALRAHPLYARSPQSPGVDG